jgi:hypothetical protein
MSLRLNFAALPIGLLVAATACLTASVPTYINVTSVVHDEDTAVPPNQFLTRSDDYNGSFQATYTNTAKAGTSGVSNHIDAGGGSYQMYLGNQSLRTIWLTLSKPVAGSPAAPAPDGPYYANVELYSQCFDVNNQATGWLVIPPGYANNRCNLGVDFSSGGVKYKLVMGPTTSGTGWATVNCNGGNSAGACNSWTLTPNTVAGSGNVPTVANLYQFSSAKGNIVLVYIGSYYNTFLIDVTNP